MSQKLFTFNAPEDVGECMVMVIDLQDSTKFFASFGGHKNIHKYLNHFIRSLNGIFGLEQEFWAFDDKDYDPITQPDYWKFLGDGFLLIWRRNRIEDKEILALLNRLRLWRQDFNGFNDYARRKDVSVPLDQLPTGFRVGISFGQLKRIKYSRVDKYEWVGRDINLATRLQSFCKGLNFLTQGLDIDHELLEDYGWINVTAKKIRGIGDVDVAVDPEEFNRLSVVLKKRHFKK
jgi:class 3 adenylate cyclase